MLDVTKFYKNGNFGYRDHVAQITNIGDNLVLDIITDFGDHLEKQIKADTVKQLKVVCYE